MKKTLSRKIIAACSALLIAPSITYAVDSASFEFGAGNKTKMVRAGLQWKWDQQWWKSNGSHIGGYWDLTLSQWRGERYQGTNSNQNLTDLGFTPVFRFQRDNLKGPYAEAGIGVHYLSGLYDNNGRRLSTRFQFGDHLGVGYVFQSGVDLGLKIQHFSNGGIKQPNNGVNFAVVRLSYPF